MTLKSMSVRPVPVMPPEIILLPKWFPFHLSKISYWARTVLVPLTVLMARRPVLAIEVLPESTRLAALLRPTDRVWIHDYHLIPLARELRKLGLQNRIGFFLHIPFPNAQLFASLPWRRDIITGLLGAATSNMMLQNAAGSSLAEIWGHPAWRWMFWAQAVPAVLDLHGVSTPRTSRTRARWIGIASVVAFAPSCGFYAYDASVAPESGTEGAQAVSPRANMT